MLICYFKTAARTVLFITPMFMHSTYNKQAMKKRIYLFPFFYYSQYNEKDWLFTIPLLALLTKRTQYQYTTSNNRDFLFTILLVFWFNKHKFTSKNDATDTTKDTVFTSYNNVFLPLYWVYHENGEQEGKKTDSLTRSLILPLLLYFFTETIKDEVQTLVNIFY